MLTYGRFMIAFAAVGPMFKLGKGVDERGRSINEYLQVLTLALMGTRAALICQYLQTLLLCRKFKGVKLPLAITASIYGTSSITYGLLAISFDGKEAHWTWIVWYIVGAVESILVTLVSSICRNVSFKRTHLVQRMSLLTLIILGEGAISVAKQCQTLAKADTFPWNATNIIDIICAVLILYFLYMIYFDWIEEHGDFGAIREQIWACLHFFLHLALVLAVQGLKLCILWSAAIAAVKTKHLALTWSQSPSGGFANVTNATDRTQTAWHWYNLAEPIVIDQGYNIKTYAGALDTETDLLRLQKARDYIIVNGSSDAAGAEAALDVMKYTASKSVFTMAGFKKLDLIKAEEDWNLTLTHPSNSSVGSIYGPLSDNASSIDGTFDLTFCYFFTATGFTVLMCALMACFSQTLKRPYHWIRLGFSAVVGSTLCLMATMVVGENETYTHFTMSSWLLPTVTILLAMGESHALENTAVVLADSHSCIAQQRDTILSEPRRDWEIKF